MIEIIIIKKKHKNITKAVDLNYYGPSNELYFQKYVFFNKIII